MINKGLKKAASSRHLIIMRYTAKNAFTGASVGDVITQTQILDVTTNTPVSVGVVWRNQTTASDLASAPAIANLTFVG